MSSFLIISLVTCTLYLDALVIELFKICLVMVPTLGEGTLSKVLFDASVVKWEFFWPGGQVNRLVKKSVYTRGRRKLWMTPAILMRLGEQRGGDHFFGGEGVVDPSRYHILKKKTDCFLDISLQSAEGYSRYKTKVKVKNNLIQSSPPLIKNIKEIRIC